MGYSPTPPRRLDAVRRHLWTIVWQPVGEGVRVGDWAALERHVCFVVDASSSRSGSDVEPYRIELPSFEVEPTSITIEDGVARYVASPLCPGAATAQSRSRCRCCQRGWRASPAHATIR